MRRFAISGQITSERCYDAGVGEDTTTIEYRAMPLGLWMPGAWSMLFVLPSAGCPAVVGDRRFRLDWVRS